MQLKFEIEKLKTKSFGGELLKGKRKTARPFCIKRPVHLVIKSKLKNVFDPKNERLSDLILFVAINNQVHLYDCAVNWSHIHFILKFESKEQYRKFIRILTSKLAIGIRAKYPDAKNIFTSRPFTRPVNWGKDLKGLRLYFQRNRRQSGCDSEP